MHDRARAPRARVGIVYSIAQGLASAALEGRRLGGRRLIWPALLCEQLEYVLRCELLEHVIGYGIHVETFSLRFHFRTLEKVYRCASKGR